MLSYYGSAKRKTNQGLPTSSYSENTKNVTNAMLMSNLSWFLY